LAVRAPGDYDPNTGWPPDDSTGVNWQNDVDLPGQFGPGGFRASPKLTAPVSGPPPGMSLPTTQAAPTNAAGMGPHIDPTTGQPEMLTGPGGIAEKTAGGFNPLSLLGGGNPYWRGAIAAGGVLTPTPAETGEFNPAMVTGRPDAPLPLHMPHRPVTPTPGAAPMPARPVTPTPITAYPTPTPPPRPRAAGPAAVKQQPNLGYFTTGDRPNANPDIGGGMLGGGFAGGRGGPVGNRTMGMLDLSKLFSRQQ
jgi:hypothetical protein